MASPTKRAKTCIHDQAMPLDDSFINKHILSELCEMQLIEFLRECVRSFNSGNIPQENLNYLFNEIKRFRNASDQQMKDLRTHSFVICPERRILENPQILNNSDQVYEIKTFAQSVFSKVVCPPASIFEVINVHFDKKTNEINKVEAVAGSIILGSIGGVSINHFHGVGGPAEQLQAQESRVSHHQKFHSCVKSKEEIMAGGYVTPHFHGQIPGLNLNSRPGQLPQPPPPTPSVQNQPQQAIATLTEKLRQSERENNLLKLNLVSANDKLASLQLQMEEQKHKHAEELEEKDQIIESRQEDIKRCYEQLQMKHNKIEELSSLDAMDVKQMIQSMEKKLSSQLNEVKSNIISSSKSDVKQNQTVVSLADSTESLNHLHLSEEEEGNEPRENPSEANEPEPSTSGTVSPSTSTFSKRIKEICPYRNCAEGFRNAYEMHQHVQSEHKETLASCPFCGLFYAFFEYHDHVVKCANAFGKPLSFGKASVKCDICDKYFKTKKILKLHQQEEHGKECEYRKCKQIFFHDDDLSDHAKEKHKETLESCPICRKSLAFFQYHDHVLKCIDKSEESITAEDFGPGAQKCELCDKYFASKRSLNIHKDNGHGKKCDTCGEYLKHSDSLKVHKRQVHGDPIYCKFCNKKINNSGNIKRHINENCPKNPERKA